LPAQAWSRKAGQLSGAYSSIAARKIAFTWLDCSPIIFAPAVRTPLYMLMRILAAVFLMTFWSGARGPAGVG
jgi:hypothetical protein